MIRKCFILLFVSSSSWAALTANTTWYIRAGGNAANGGGFDGTTANAGTNYANQDAAQLTLTDVDTPASNSTNIRSVSGGFTAAMIGNILQLSLGTNFTSGYYLITGVTSSTSAIVDRTPAASLAGSGGNIRVGGAWPNFGNMTTGGANSPQTPACCASPLVAGNLVMVRGAGSDDPAVASADYDYSTNSGEYQTWTPGTALGRITIRGFNGRPEIKVDGLFVYNTNWLGFEHLKFVENNVVTYQDWGTCSVCQNAYFTDVIWDQNGVDVTMQGGTNGTNNYAISVRNSEFRNTGSKAVGTKPALGFSANNYFGAAEDVYIHDVRGQGMIVEVQSGPRLYDVVISSVVGDCIDVTDSGTTYTAPVFNHVVVDSCGGDGINISATNQVMTVEGLKINNPIFSNITGTGKKAINFVSGTTLTNDRESPTGFIDYNDFYNDTANYGNKSAGPHDFAINPAYSNSANGSSSDWSVTAAGLKNVGWPPTFKGSATLSYPDVGAVQVNCTGGAAVTRGFVCAN